MEHNLLVQQQDWEAIRQAALKTLREDLALAQSQAFFFTKGDAIEALERQIKLAEAMVFMGIGPTGLPAFFHPEPSGPSE